MAGPVICGVDFSDHSQRALAWARGFARALHQPLIVVHAVETVLAEAARITYGTAALEDSIRPDLEAFVQPEAGTELEIAAGSPAGAVHGAALAHRASMIVVGTQGLGRAGRLWFGSTTLGLLRESTIPVLGVPPRATDDVSVSRIVVGTDFSEPSARAVASARDLGSLLEAPVTCLHVVKAPAAHLRWNEAVATITDAAVQDARRRIAEAITDPAITAEVRTGDPADVLIAEAEGRDVLIVVGLGGANPSQRPGTTAYRVLSGADAPVLAVPSS